MAEKTRVIRIRKCGECPNLYISVEGELDPKIVYKCLGSNPQGTAKVIKAEPLKRGIRSMEIDPPEGVCWLEVLEGGRIIRVKVCGECTNIYTCIEQGMFVHKCLGSNPRGTAMVIATQSMRGGSRTMELVPPEGVCRLEVA